MILKSTKQEYEGAISKRDYYKNELKEQGISGKDDWDKQVHSLVKLETRLPYIQSQIQPLQSGLGLLDAVLQGIEQAGRETQNQQRRNERMKNKEKSKGHSPGKSFKGKIKSRYPHSYKFAINKVYTTCFYIIDSIKD